MTLFAVVIAITKDLPDVEGDKANNIETFATKMGVRNVSLIGRRGEAGEQETVYVTAEEHSCLSDSIFYPPSLSRGPAAVQLHRRHCAGLLQGQHVQHAGHGRSSRHPRRPAALPGLEARPG